MKAHQRTIGATDTWLTPRWILDPLGAFELDPCAARDVAWPTAINHICLPNDGLRSEWFGRVWLNPPFNRYQRPQWMAKMAAHRHGTMLVPAATETEAFYQYVWEAADAVLFLRGRPHFHDMNGVRAKANSGCSIALVAYGETDAAILAQSGLGKFIRLTP